MSLFGGSTNSDTNKSNQDDKPKESGTPAANIAQKDFALLFAKKEEPTAANGEEAKKPEGTEKPALFGSLFSNALPAKEEKKDESPTKPSGSLFSNSQGGSLFGNLGSNLAGTFTVPSTLGSGLLGGNVTAAPTLSGGLFGNVSTDPTNPPPANITNTETAATTTGTTGTISPQKAGGLFSGGGGLFAGAGTTATTSSNAGAGAGAAAGSGSGGLFGGGTAGGLFAGAGTGAGALPTTGGGLFGGGGIFGVAGTTATTGTTAGAGGLFGSGTAGGLFGGNTGGTGTGTGTGGGLFGNNSSPAKPAAGGLNLGTLKGNAQYTPNLNAPTTGKTGTVNYDLKFGKSNENYEIYSITCASNADKNKSIEELRAEDYELIRTGELPEALQLKIIDNRERLEKNLGFVLPVPTPSSSNKAYTKVFKSTARNTSMKSTFMNNKYADVKFKVENEEIPAHRNVLGLCSPFFDDLFTKHQSDTFPLVIEIPDIKAETFRAIMEFLYTGEVNLHEDLAVDLILNGSRFDVNDLVQAADDFISKMINIDNYMKVLEISDRLSSKPLRKKVFTFIVRNMKMISKREDFEELPRDFLMEILENAIAA